MYINGQHIAANYSRAEECYTQAAVLGDANAQWMLGRMYYDGITNRGYDFPLALHWFNESATNGSARGQLYLGMVYEYGLGLAPPAFDKAVEMYTLGSLQGDGEAQFYLGVMYLHGRGTAQDLAKGASLIRGAANAGFSPAMDTLGKLYTDKAWKWTMHLQYLGSTKELKKVIQW